MKTQHPGITYTRLVDDTPLSVHVVKANPELCRVVPARALNSGVGRECLTSIAERYKALAAINGGYFVVGGAFDGKSHGALKIRERWFASPDLDCSSVAWNENDTKVLMSRIAMAWHLTIGDFRLPIDGINIPVRSGKAVLYTSAFHKSTLSAVGTLEILILGGHVVAVRKGGDSVIPEGGYVYGISSDNPSFSLPFSTGMNVKLSHKIGLLDERFEDRATTTEEVAFWQECDYIMSGAPLLIQNGTMTEEFSHDSLKDSILNALHPRAAVGVTAGGEWLFVVVEGRQPLASIGMSVVEVAELMEDLGCVDALNLDGGASCQLLVEGQQANIPIFNGIEGLPHELGQRRISDAFLILER